MKKFITCMTALLLVLLLSGSALAETVENRDSSVTYVDRTELFDFKPGSEYEVTDLFENFKNVMPGDVLEEYVTVQNSNKEKIRIWMQCKYDSYVETDARDFLAQLKLTVETSDETIFEAAADQKAQLSGPVLLGTFKKNGKVELKVTLEVPITLGNEYMNQIGVVPWTFLIEEIPEDDTPETGDWFEVGLWIGAAVILTAAIAWIIIILYKRRNKDEE